MKKKEFLVSEILDSFNITKIKGHFSKKKYDLGNGRYGKDIFTFFVKKEEKGYVVKIGGVYKHGIVNLLHKMGLCYKKEHGVFILIRKQRNIIYEISHKEIKDLVSEYLYQLPYLEVEINGSTESFSPEAQIELFYRQTNLVLNDSFLEFLKEDKTSIITDTSDSVILFFDNGILEVTESDVNLNSYSSFTDGLVWRESVIDFKLGIKDVEKCNFSLFINNVCNNDEDRVLALKSALGYLLHSFNRKSGGQMVLLYDESITNLDSPQGGTGKGVIANAIATLRETVKMDGKKFKGDNRFDFQDVTVSSRVLWLDDVGKQMDIDRFNSISTDGFNIEKKHQKSILIPPASSPKILICSNIILDCSGTTRKRRQFIIELSNYYSSKITTGIEEPIVAEHGARFFTDEWDNVEWNRFYWYMIDCAKLYLSKGLIPAPGINIIENRLRQIIGEDLYKWIKLKEYTVGENYNTKTEFKEYKDLYEDGDEKCTQRSFSNKLKSFFNHQNKSIEFFTESRNSEKISLFRIRN
ncbi:hypothetical protein ERX46_05455 [Brumimicrobium glaciale]|uniref:SF3 helicase domain-containing protein n=1 Tax=Brumimicrobium glaciale TaxID=200475 RepID=A0A4Q4KN94_9FLAO|nr:primase-helicase family protein [Brumimicrobium glaciale]RYM34822.1 hypothetical protein ERX46_05455 [Brumimicrobium glaciale]